MLIAAAEVDDGRELTADVCVVGGGPAGLTVASRLADTGLTVLLLEAGAAAPPPGGADITSTRSVGLPYPLLASRARGLGGSSLRWDIVTPAGSPFVRLRELDELDFEQRTTPPVPGWPFSKAHLDRYYAAAWEVFGLSRPDPAREQVLAGPVESRTFSFGPASTFTTRLPAALAAHAHVTVLTDALVTDIRSDERSGRVSGLRCRTSQGRTLTATADRYVLAAGGLENARLLLASRSSQPVGLGNAHDHVGRYFMEHPHYASAVLVPGDGRLARDPQAWDLLASRGRAEQRKYAVAPDVVRAEGLLNAAFYLAPRSWTKPVPVAGGRLDEQGMRAVHQVRGELFGRRLPSWEATVRLAGSSPALGRSALRQLVAQRAQRSGRPSRWQPMFTVAVMAEQEPLSGSRLRLTDVPDEAGVPQALLDWRTGPTDAQSMRRSQALVGTALQEAYGGTVHSLLDGVELPHLGVGYHHMGTTRMAPAAVDGVVDPDCRVHGVDNLYLAGSSVFPTGGFANPTLTVVALAVRLAEHLGAR